MQVPDITAMINPVNTECAGKVQTTCTGHRQGTTLPLSTAQVTLHSRTTCKVGPTMEKELYVGIVKLLLQH